MEGYRRKWYWWFVRVKQISFLSKDESEIGKGLNIRRGG